MDQSGEEYGETGVSRIVFEGVGQGNVRRLLLEPMGPPRRTTKAEGIDATLPILLRGATNAKSPFDSSHDRDMGILLAALCNEVLSVERCSGP